MTLAPLLTVEHLTKEFHTPRGVVRAVNDVSFVIPPGEAFGLVGESGSGKSTAARCIMRLIQPTGGRIILDGLDATAADKKQLAVLRQRMQIVFQDPFASLNPRMKIEDLVAEGLDLYAESFSRVERRAKVIELLELVGLDSGMLDRYPRQFSGGQRQRISVARALAVSPTLLICDEVVSALDVSVQAQILNLFMRLRTELRLTLLFIAHDLDVVRHVCDSVGVMYRGELVEVGPCADVFNSPSHEYTKGLLQAKPTIGLTVGASDEY